MRKVFCVGLPKTGTSSMAEALKRLDYSTAHSFNINEVIDKAQKFDALADGTVAPYMEVLDRLWPEALFIFTIRNEEEWLESCRKHYSIRFATHNRDMDLWSRRVIWGREDYNRGTFWWMGRYHTARVLDYFKDRSEKLLVLDICAGEGYDKLCPFLGIPILDEPFPHKNEGK